MQMAVNHYSHFYLFKQLKTLLEKESRVIVVSSRAHEFGEIDFNNGLAILKDY